MAALQHWLREAPPISVLIDPTGALEDPGISQSAVAMHFRLAATQIWTAAASAGKDSPDLYGRLLLVLNHPSVILALRHSGRLGRSSFPLR